MEEPSALDAFPISTCKIDQSLPVSLSLPLHVPALFANPEAWTSMKNCGVRKRALDLVCFFEVLFSTKATKLLSPKGLPTWSMEELAEEAELVIRFAHGKLGRLATWTVFWMYDLLFGGCRSSCGI